MKTKEKIRKGITCALAKATSSMRHLRGWYYRCLIRALGGQCQARLMVDSRFVFKYPPHAGIKIGYGVYLGRNVVIDVPLGSSLTLGNHVNLTQSIVIAAEKSIYIGNDVLVAEFTSIRDADHGIRDSKLIREQPLVAKPVHVGNDVWIGRGVAILKGITIGDGAVIGANAVVTKDICPSAIAVGNPARVLKMRNQASEHRNGV